VANALTGRNPRQDYAVTTKHRPLISVAVVALRRLHSLVKAMKMRVVFEVKVNIAAVVFSTAVLITAIANAYLIFTL
jgi:hypothetical protein